MHLLNELKSEAWDDLLQLLQPRTTLWPQGLTPAPKNRCSLPRLRCQLLLFPLQFQAVVKLSISQRHTD